MLSAFAKRRLAPPSAAVISRRIARAAIRSLYAELTLSPKPGLVCPGDNGSHRDMTATTLFRSLFALRHYFRAIARAGCDGAPFSVLQRLGIAAEARMLAATGGVNTHRGSIFNLGLLCAAAAYLQRDGKAITVRSLARTVRKQWAAAIMEASPTVPSHGLLAAARYGAGGARLEAILGFPSVFEFALPVLCRNLQRGLSARCAHIETLFTLIAQLEDTNLLYRGGVEGLRFAQRAAAGFLARGGVAAPNWTLRARAVCDAFVSRRLSPGGSADLLAATIFVHALIAA